MLLLWPGEVRRKWKGDSGRTLPALFAGSNNQSWVNFFFCRCPIGYGVPLELSWWTHFCHFCGSLISWVNRNSLFRKILRTVQRSQDTIKNNWCILDCGAKGGSVPLNFGSAWSWSYLVLQFLFQDVSQGFCQTGVRDQRLFLVVIVEEQEFRIFIVNGKTKFDVLLKTPW